MNEIIINNLDGKLSIKLLKLQEENLALMTLKCMTDMYDMVTGLTMMISSRVCVTEFQKTLVQELSDRADDVQSGNVDPSVINILDRQEYVGDTVNFKTYHTSFKDKKVRKNSREDYVIIRDTQEPIISREEFEKAQKRRNANKRISAEKQFHLLDGMVFCGDCKNRMYLNCKKRKTTATYIYLCNRYKKEKLCSAHYVREDFLIKTVLERISFLQEKFAEGKVEFRRYIYSAITNRTSAHIKQVNSRMEAIQKRLDEIRTVEAKMYEDKLLGKVDEETFNNITHVLNKEVKNLTDENSQLLVILDKVDDLKNGIDSFVQKIERFADYPVTENDRIIIEQLIDHIEIHENENGEVSVKIFFADVGVIE